MTKRTLLTAALLSALSLNITGLSRAQEAEANVTVKRDGVKANQDVSGSASAESRTSYSGTQRSGIGPMHKASGVIGMEVKNHQGEKLGDIEDLVLDLETGKISYAVLAVGGFLGIGEKYLAIPVNAFQKGTDGTFLTLNADKAKIQGAPGFAKTNWPDPSNPSWGANSSYWLGAGSGRSASGTLQDRPVEGRTDLDRDADRSLELRHQSDLDRKNLDADRPSVRGDVRLDTDRSVEHRNAMTFKGTIQSVDVEKRMLTVKGETGTKQFRLESDAKLNLKGYREGTLSDLKTGQQVVIGYHQEGGSFVAHSLTKTAGAFDR